MVRTQVQLTEKQVTALKRLAAERGVSMAALIRDALDRVLEEPDPDAVRRRALAAVGKFASRDGANASEEHDRYLEEIYAGR